MYDPSMLHYWTETRRRGEWPTTTISPACTPSITRDVSTELVDAQPGTIARATSSDLPGVQCADCADIVAAIKERV